MSIFRDQDFLPSESSSLTPSTYSSSTSMVSAFPQVDEHRGRTRLLAPTPVRGQSPSVLAAPSFDLLAEAARRAQIDRLADDLTEMMTVPKSMLILIDFYIALSHLPFISGAIGAPYVFRRPAVGHTC
ncbi:hypothetical protein CANCADRAFT_66417 [Tortispora caseinolytica NRRL Y-17796]|uniref:Uncharacterized protein n=1 Tax=Tortispora caseinolytica NRRL Y-17796 TaxID=767744 RepID=A0A1E4TIA4_9ASCO|nr:hypothetical protein CANCADRAFT_66417 [Tortispora caseinolytica NRRL Y-17796]